MTASAEEQQWGNRTLAAMNAYGFGMVGFVLAMDMVILPVLVIGVAPDDLKATFLAVLGVTGLIIAGAMQPIIGRASDRANTPLGRRIPFMLWGSAFVCLGLIGLGFSPNYPILLAVWVFMQANVNVGYGPYQALIRDLVPANRIGVASSLKILSDAAGALVLIGVSGALIGRGASSKVDVWVWLSLGAIAISIVLSTLITSLTVRAKESAVRLLNGGAGETEAQAGSLHPQLGRYVLSRLLIMTAITAFPTFGLFFLKDVLEPTNPAQTLAALIAPVGGSLVFGVIVAGWLSGRIGLKPVILPGAIGAAATSIWLIWGSDSLKELVVVTSVLGAFIGVILSSYWALANELGTKGREAVHMGIVNLATTGGSGAAKLMGFGIDPLNRASDGWGYDALLITSSSLFIIGAFLLLPIKIQIPGRTPINAPEEAT